MTDASSSFDDDRKRLCEDLLRLGVREGSVLLVQASLRSVGLTAGGAELMVRALLDALGPDGTLVVPTFTSLNSTTSRAHKARVARMSVQEEASYISSLPGFDPLESHSDGMGAIAEYVRTRSDAVRSSHPHTSFAAVGPQAVELTKVHDLECHLGPNSPLGWLHEHNADNLLLGLEYHQGCTMIHMAEYVIAAERAESGRPVSPRDYRARIADADTPDRWVTFQDLDLDDSDFMKIGAAYDKPGAPRPGLHRGRIGAAESRLVGSRHVVAFAAAWMRENRD